MEMQHSGAGSRQMGTTIERGCNELIKKGTSMLSLRWSSRSWPQHPTRGYVPPQYLRASTLAMNQPGAGMKWYPEYLDAGAKRRDLQRLNKIPVPK